MSPRPTKRSHIVEVAADVFAAHGYTRASMDAIAAAAGVTKQTVYNNFGDKDQLFAAATREVLERLGRQAVALISQMPATLERPEEDLSAFGLRWARMFLDPQAAALRRLVISEVAHHPQLLYQWVTAGPSRADAELAVLLERWSSAGSLRIPDPAVAARQLRLLITAEPWNRSAFGTELLDDATLAHMIEPNVRLFVRAYS